MIQVENLSFGFPTKELYKDVSFTIEAGQHCAFIGSNGTGKTTLIDMILDSEKHLYDGKIILDEDCRDMKEIPDMIFIVDPRKERICVQEAHTLGIPLVGIADTNCDPEELDFVIPGNDDAIRAVKLIVSKMADAVIEANQGVDAEVAEEVEDAE